MKKKLLSLALAVLMLLSILPAAAYADGYIAEVKGVGYNSLSDAFNNAGYFDQVKLLGNLDSDIVIPEMVFLDLNHFTLNKNANIVNDGCIIFYQENADVIDDLLYNVPGTYSAGENIELSYDGKIQYIIPQGTFMSMDIENDSGDYRDVGMVTENVPVIWNADVPAGVHIRAVEALTLGGNILAPKSASEGNTEVTATCFALSDDITVGSKNYTYGQATLFIESYDSGLDDEHVMGTFNANGHKIIINNTGRVVVSADVDFDESVLVSGSKWATVSKDYDSENDTYVYTVSVAVFNIDFVKLSDWISGLHEFMKTYDFLDVLDKIEGIVQYVFDGAKLIFA